MSPASSEAKKRLLDRTDFSHDVLHRASRTWNSPKTMDWVGCDSGPVGVRFPSFPTNGILVFDALSRHGLLSRWTARQRPDLS